MSSPDERIHLWESSDLSVLERSEHVNAYEENDRPGGRKPASVVAADGPQSPVPIIIVIARGQSQEKARCFLGPLVVARLNRWRCI